MRPRHMPVWLSLAVALVAGVIAFGAGVAIESDDDDGRAAGSGSSRPGAAEVSTPAGFASNLYVLDGARGWATRTGKAWTLTLSGADRVLWFADRPDRASGVMTAADLAKAWNGEFGEDPPNGAVVAPDAAGENPVAIVLGAPTWDDDAGTISFGVTPDGEKADSDTAWLEQLTESSAAERGHVSLFVDSSNYTDTFNVLAGGGGEVFTPNPGASTCATPGALTATGGATGGSPRRAVYQGTVLINNTGGCYWEDSEAVWDVTTDGEDNGNFRLSSGGGSLSLDGCTEETCTTDGLYYDFG